MDKKFLSKRYFLNPKEGVAAAAANASVNYRIKRSNINKYPALDVDASLSISDCNRQVHLEFDVWLGGDEKEARRTLKDRRAKLERLRQIVDEFVAQTTKAYDFVEQNMDEYFKLYKEADENQKRKKG